MTLVGKRPEVIVMETFLICGGDRTERHTTPGQVFVTSDWHLGHGQHRPTEPPRGIIKHMNRPFSCAGEMDQAIIERCNERVGEDDWLIYLGDLFFARQSSTGAQEAMATSYLARLRCPNVVFLWGNHDDHLRGSSRFRALFRGVHERIELRLRGQSYICDHYPLAAWNRSFHGSRCLYGHCHGRLDDPSFPGFDPALLRLDVGVDSHDFYPLDFDQIERLMQPKEAARKQRYGSGGV
jgi:calcineurin-like phosphoesterase family protein